MNSLPTRELFGSSQSTTQNDFSQLQNAQFTQFEMSQYNSQDFSSQSLTEQHSFGSNTESQGRPMSAYEKYMTAPSLFKNKDRALPRGNSSAGSVYDGVKKKSLPTSNFHQQIAAQKARAKEKDERDILSSIVNTVQVCSDEVKNSLHSMKAADEDNAEMLKNLIRTLTESVETSNKKILEAVKLREELSCDISSLNRQIEQKDQKIQELLQKTQDLHHERNKAEPGSGEMVHMMDSMKTFLIELHQQMDSQIQKVVDITQKHMQLTKKVGDKQKVDADENNKNMLDLKYRGQRDVQDCEKRLMDELVSIRDDIDRKKRDAESFIRSQIQSMQQKYSRDLKQQIQAGFSDGLQRMCDSVNNTSGSAVSEDFLKVQRNMETFIESNVAKQTKQILKNNQDLYRREQKDFHKNVETKLEMLREDQRNYSKETKSCWDTLINADRPWLNDNVPKKVQDQLNELHDKHQAEIKRLEEQIQQGKQRVSTKEKTCSNPVAAPPLMNVYNFEDSEINAKGDARTSYVGPMFKKKCGFLSPRPPQGNWNSKTLFACRDLVSPVAKVLPQRLQSESTDMKKDRLDKSQNYPSSQVTNDRQEQSTMEEYEYQPAKSDTAKTRSKTGKQTHRKKGRKKRGNGWSSKTRATKGTISESSVPAHIPEVNSTECNTEVAFRPRPTMTKQSLPIQQNMHRNIFDFSDEGFESTAVIKPHAESSCSEEWIASSQSHSSDSENSPGLSITEVFIKRRVRCDRKSPDANECFSTDLAMREPYLGKNQEQDIHNGSVEPMTRETRPVQRCYGGKRRLIDVDTQFFQMIQQKKRLF